MQRAIPPGKVAKVGQATDDSTRRRNAPTNNNVANVSQLGVNNENYYYIYSMSYPVHLREIPRSEGKFSLFKFIVKIQ